MWIWVSCRFKIIDFIYRKICCYNRMKKRILIIIFVIIGIVVFEYAMQKINLDTSYFGKSIAIQYASFFLFYVIPLLLVLLFFKKTIKLVAKIIITILILCFLYGCFYIGIHEMFSQYLIITTAFLLTSTVLCVLTVISDWRYACRENSFRSFFLIKKNQKIKTAKSLTHKQLGIVCRQS